MPQTERYDKEHSQAELHELAARLPCLTPEEVEQNVIVVQNGVARFANYEDRFTELGEPHLPTVEVCGMPDSYKSTVISASLLPIRSNGVEVAFITEAEAEIDKVRFPFEYALAKGMRTLEKHVADYPPSDRITIIERGVFDLLCFLQAFNLDSRVLSSLDRVKTSINLLPELYRIYQPHEDAIFLVNGYSTQLDEKMSQRKDQPLYEGLNNLNSQYLGLPETLAIFQRNMIQRHSKPVFIFPIHIGGMRNPAYYKMLSEETGELDRGLWHSRNLCQFGSRLISSTEEYQDLFLRSMGSFARVTTSGGFK